MAQLSKQNVMLLNFYHHCNTHTQPLSTAHSGILYTLLQTERHKINTLLNSSLGTAAKLFWICCCVLLGGLDFDWLTFCWSYPIKQVHTSFNGTWQRQFCWSSMLSPLTRQIVVKDIHKMEAHSVVVVHLEFRSS